MQDFFPSIQIKFLKMEMEKKTKIIKDLQQEVLSTTIFFFIIFKEEEVLLMY